MTAAKFAAELQLELGLAREDLNRQIRRIALQALQGIVLRTPVDEGTARANWFVTINGSEQPTIEDRDPTGQEAIARGNAVIGTYENVEGFPTITVYNNLPYIVRLENGYSDQAPRGMVVVTATEIEAQFR